MPVFSLVVVGDRRLSVANYRFLRAKLDELLGNHLPDVRVLSGGGLAVDVLAERWAEEHGLPVERFPPRRDYLNEGQYVEWVMACGPSGLVLFDGGAGESDELVRRVRVRGLPVRVVSVVMYIKAR
jgi:hypothetical protein